MSRVAVWAVCVVLAGCVGRISTPAPVATNPDPVPPDPVPGRPPSPFTCDAAAAPPSLPLERLSRDEYVNTLHAFLSSAMPQSGEGIFTALGPAIAKVPPDAVTPMPGERRGGFSRLDQTVQQATVDETYNVAVTAGAALTDTPAHLAELMGACATDADTTNDATCLDDFVTRLGAVAERHPLAPEEKDLLVQTAGATPVDPAAVADVVAVMLTMPGFLYRLESGDQAVAPDVYALDAHELAARLSYHFWQAPPDAELLAAADSGALLTDDGYRAQVDRLVADPRSAQALDAFFSQWFRLDELGPLDSRVGDPVYDAFAGASTPSPGLRQAMFDEVLDSTRAAVHGTGTLDQLMEDAQNYARTDELAALYGVSRWDGVSATQALPPERAGLLTRAAFLATGTANTRPVMKGLRIRNALLCDPVPPPPNNANAMPLPLSPTDTTREVLEKLTQQEGTACATCHAVMLNPLGFSTENFDALGRARATQTLYDATGSVLASKPVDTSSVPRVVLADTTPSTGVADVTRLIGQSGKFDTCFARQYFRFTFRRPEVDAADGCALLSLDGTARASSLADAFKQVALRPEFKTRRIVP